MNGAPPARAGRTMRVRRPALAFPSYRIVSLEAVPWGAVCTVAVAGVADLDIHYVRRRGGRQVRLVVPRGVQTKRFGFVRTFSLDAGLAVAIRGTIEAELAERDRQAS